MTKNIIVTAIVALVVSLGIGFLLPSPAIVMPDESNLGGLSERDVKAVSSQIGSNGSKFTFVKATTCNLVGGAIAATSSAITGCAVSGVLNGDLVLATLATSSNAVITGARASTTAGHIAARIFNLTGAVSSVTALGTSTVIYVFRATN